MYRGVTCAVHWAAFGALRGAACPAPDPVWPSPFGRCHPLPPCVAASGMSAPAGSASLGVAVPVPISPPRVVTGQLPVVVPPVPRGDPAVRSLTLGRECRLESHHVPADLNETDWISAVIPEMVQRFPFLIPHSSVLGGRIRRRLIMVC